ncbi:2-oxoacid:ferredoxin oxidoreductase subunit beta [Microbispora sp. NBRC 16548]|uniref:2-oxoacid:ferredoxin oxidoreductase subunit beta n=1 Tax=Microbispora sp. NBRC 16548 TaxID=3030994 RepID=UPI0016163149|nr:2-oxoacid:ferredoxin oxidoreductase subunit beta [Microbispora sp. NBRC 16548]GLX11148.1 2-oxoglutarate ferredoxin oxidoreductase subunit beta [Microbispora sp. NBRC 16548]
MTVEALPFPGLRGVPAAEVPSGAKDYSSDQEVRWCPGCGDYVILKTIQGFLPELGLRRENIVFISGIGCSSRFPYYLDTYGMHSIHGRAPAIATGLATTRSDLSVWVVTGDGDALSIGGNHLIHAMRRNVNLKILLFNNRIYGLTKGQFSPTSEAGKVTKSSPDGSVGSPFNPVALALGADATFVARAIDSDRAGLTEVLRAAAAHRGTALVEIYQNCPIFNDGAFEVLKNPSESVRRLVRLRDGAAYDIDGRRYLHDEKSASAESSWALARLDDGSMERVPVGIFRRVERPVFDDQVREKRARAGEGDDDAFLSLLAGADPWTVTRPSS